ncbi:hypothetical protein NMG60_11019533 [Bertholletia excelsa]
MSAGKERLPYSAPPTKPPSAMAATTASIANKLAEKHVRFTLQHPSAREFPRCDICQERRAFLFCREDRAILCRECDVPIHKANEHTQKHTRFLLTGVKLSSSQSSSSSSAPNPASSSSNGCDFVIDSDFKSSVSKQFSNPSSNQKAALLASSTNRGEDCMSQENSMSTSSISQYLVETLPGWRVDDFLDPLFSPPDLCKFPECDAKSELSSSPMEDLASWVPQAPTQSSQIHRFYPNPVQSTGF